MRANYYSQNHLHLQQQQQQNQNQAQQGLGQPALAAPAPAPAPANVAPPASGSSLLKVLPREGSWVYLIDIISPGLNLSDFESPHSQADADRQTSLASVKFISCGYAKLPYIHYDQSAIEPANPVPKNPIFTKKYISLQPAMLSSKWPLLGEIVQEVDANELAALNAGWYLETGWKDTEEATAPEFDGCLPGGTGRFTGEVCTGDRLTSDPH
jgi:hypothetical protein